MKLKNKIIYGIITGLVVFGVLGIENIEILYDLFFIEKEIIINAPIHDTANMTVEQFKEFYHIPENYSYPVTDTIKVE